MAGRRIDVLDVCELVRRLKCRQADRAIARDMGISRNTVKRYRRWAEEKGLAESDVPPRPGEVAEALRPPAEPAGGAAASKAGPFREFIAARRREGVGVKALLGLLRERGFAGSYGSVLRMVHRIESRTPEAFVRVETAPGEEAQVDFGSVGRLHDPASGRKRKAWVFVMTLSYSRHQYAEIVFDQTVETWTALHVRALESFGGSPARIVPDNLKAGIVKAVLHDAEPQRSYRELAEHYGFLISPCRPYTPRHKGKVERGVAYIKGNALAGREFADVAAANAHLSRWVAETAGVRDHGTTREPPLVRFGRERPALRPLPESRWEPTSWRRLKLHEDCHVVFDGSHYSAPHRLVGRELWLKATPSRVELYHEHQRAAAHPRAGRRGEWATHPGHLPPAKLHGLSAEPAVLRAQAALVGPKAAELADLLLSERPMDRRHAVAGVLRLGRKFGPERLEAACARALHYGDVRYHTVRNILTRGLDAEPVVPAAAPLPSTSLFARPASELMPAAMAAALPSVLPSVLPAPALTAGGL